MPNRNLKVEQNSWKTRGLCMGTCLWNLNSKSYWHCPITNDSTPWTEFAGWHHNHWSWTYNGFFESISSFASIQFWWFSVSSISCHHRLQWYIFWAPIVHCVAFRHFPDLTFKQLCLDPSFAVLHTLSWQHLHQTPSLGPFRARVVEGQIQVRQTGVLFQGLGQSLAGDKRLEKHDDEDSTHTSPKVAKCFHSCLCLSNWPTPPPTGQKRSFFGLLVFEL